MHEHVESGVCVSDATRNKTFFLLFQALYDISINCCNFRCTLLHVDA